MTETEQAVADLDAALAADGEWIELWRETGTQKIPFKVRCRAFVRGYAAQELVGGIAQTDSKVVMSQTEIIRSGWPGPNSSATSTNQDRRVPRKGDAVIIAGRKRAIEAAGGIHLGGELVRIEMRFSAKQSCAPSPTDVLVPHPQLAESRRPTSDALCQ